MATNTQNTQGQLGFDALLLDADQSNYAHQLDKDTAHMPAAMDEAIKFYWQLLESHHTAMLAADVDTVMALRGEAYKLAEKLNGGRTGILADDDSPGNFLADQTSEMNGLEPLWGQRGAFAVEIGTMKVWIEMDGIFGVAGNHCYWPGFSAHAVDPDKPFLSETGYRSFLGIYAGLQTGMGPVEFVGRLLAEYIETELRGKPVAISSEFRREGRTA